MTKLAADMRQVADALERIAVHYNTNYHAPSTYQKWSAQMLRDEANVLERGSC
jgi:hypothetical protein